MANPSPLLWSTIVTDEASPSAPPADDLTASLAQIADCSVPPVDQALENLEPDGAAPDAACPTLPEELPPDALVDLTDPDGQATTRGLFAQLQDVLRHYHLKVIRIREPGIRVATLVSLFGSLLFNALWIGCLLFVGGMAYMKEWTKAAQTDQTGQSGAGGVDNAFIVPSDSPLQSSAPPPRPAGVPAGDDVATPTVPAPGDVLENSIESPKPVVPTNDESVIAFAPQEVPFNAPRPASPKVATPAVLPSPSPSAQPAAGPSGDGIDGDDPDAPPARRHVINLAKPGQGSGTGTGDDGLGQSAANIEAGLLSGIDIDRVTPLEVANSDKKVTITFAIEVLPDGTAGRIEITQHSDYPAFEKRLLAMLRDARYRPEYVAGKVTTGHFDWTFSNRRE